MNFENEKDILKRKEKFQTLLDNSFGSGETITYINDNGYTIYLKNINEVYTIDENGVIVEEDIDILKKDMTEGILDGNGTQEDPYIIMSIEDLLEWSKNYLIYKNKYIKLGKTLDFKSELSYCNYSNTSYNMFLLGEDSEAYLFDVLTNQKYSRL